MFSTEWAAGFYEGEGSCRYSHGLQLGLSQVQRWPLERFQEAVGRPGRLTFYVPKQPHHSPNWRLEYGRDDALIIVALLRPYLSPIRIEQIDSVIAKLPIFRPGLGFCRKGHLKTHRNIEGYLVCWICRNVAHRARRAERRRLGLRVM